MSILEFTLRNRKPPFNETIRSYDENDLKIMLYGDHKIKWLGGYAYSCNCCANSFVSRVGTTQVVLKDHQNEIKYLRRLYEAGLYEIREKISMRAFQSFE